MGAQGFARVGALQFDYSPAAVLQFAYMEEPTSLGEGERGISSLHVPGYETALGDLRRSNATKYESFARKRLEQVAAKAEALELDLLVLPEYSVPASCLSVFSQSAIGSVVVAGSHTVTADTIPLCAELGLDLSTDDIGRSICPVRLQDGSWQKVDKITRSKFEGAMKPGREWGLVTARTRSGVEYRLAILLCVDFINEQDPAFMSLVPRDMWSQPDLFVVPSYTPTIRDFGAKARAVVDRLHRPVVYTNVALVGGTRIYCHFREESAFVDTYATKEVPRGDEALVVVDVAFAQQHEESPAALPVPETSSLYSMLPLLPEGTSSQYLGVYEDIKDSRSDDAKRQAIDRSEQSLAALASQPSRDWVLRTKIFALLEGRKWRSGDWIDACADCIPLATDPPTLAELRFSLLQESQEALVSILAKRGVQGRELEDVSRVLGIYRSALDSLRHSVRAEASDQYAVLDPSIHTVKESADAVTSLFMLKLTSARRHRESLAKQIALLTTVAYRRNSDLSLNLRFVSVPNPEGQLKDLQIQVVGAVRSNDVASSRQKADDYRRDLADLLRVTLREAFSFRLEEMGDQELAQAMTPFPIQDVVEIQRHVDFGVAPYIDQASAPRIMHLQGNSSMARILDVMQSSSAAIMLSVHLRPVAIDEAEQAFFRTYSHAAGYTNDTSEAAMFFLGTERHPALRMNDAVTMRKMLSDSESLRPTLLLRVLVATDVPCPRLLLNTVGVEMWGNDSYELVDHTPATERTAAEGMLKTAWIDDSLVSAEIPTPTGLGRVPYLVDPYEASRAFRLPLDADVGAVGSLFAWMACPIAVLPETGTEIGLGFHTGAQKPIVVRLPDSERTKHVYIVGKTGTGKSTLLAKMIEQDIVRGAGVCVIDPHGDLVDAIVERVPASRMDDVVLLDPGMTESPFGLNLLEYNADVRHHKDFVVQETTSIMRKLFYFEYSGPVFEHALRHLLLTMLDESMEGRGTLIEVPRLLYDDSLRRAVVPRIKDELARDFWMQYEQTSDYTRSQNLGYIISKFNVFTCDNIMRNIIGQSASTFSIPETLADRKVLLVKLQSALIGEQNAALLGMIIISKLRWACMARARMAPSEREDFYLYVDEFQNFATSGFESLLAEGRKYGLAVTVAHQHTGQLSAFDVSTGRNTQGVADAVFGNTSTMIAFRLGVDDAKKMAAEMGLPAEAEDFENLKNYYAIMKTLFRGDVYPAFTVKTVPSGTSASPENAEVIRSRSLARYNRSVDDVEQEIRDRAAWLLSPRSTQRDRDPAGLRDLES